MRETHSVQIVLPTGRTVDASLTFERRSDDSYRVSIDYESDGNARGEGSDPYVALREARRAPHSSTDGLPYAPIAPTAPSRRVETSCGNALLASERARLLFATLFTRGVRAQCELIVVALRRTVARLVQATACTHPAVRVCLLETICILPIAAVLRVRQRRLA